jgi:enoyl-CoA hydratase/carnithine racemase
MPQLDVVRRGRIAILAMNRPEHGNRVSQQMAEEIAAALEQARRDPEIGACVITGGGDVFCLGGDWQGAGPTTAGRMEFARAFIDMNHAMSRLGKPLVAAVNGNAHAGGFSIVVACDLAIVADDATLGLPEAANGLFPFLALAIVKDALPKKVLFDIVYNARLMSAEEARALSLVNAMVPRATVLDRAVAVAEKASSTNPDVLMLGRDVYYGMRGSTPSEALDHSRVALGTALAAVDQNK